MTLFQLAARRRDIGFVLRLLLRFHLLARTWRSQEMNPSAVSHISSWCTLIRSMASRLKGIELQHVRPRREERVLAAGEDHSIQVNERCGIVRRVASIPLNEVFRMLGHPRVIRRHMVGDESRMRRSPRLAISFRPRARPLWPPRRLSTSYRRTQY
jgi:hypothetical protein